MRVVMADVCIFYQRYYNTSS